MALASGPGHIFGSTRQLPAICRIRGVTEPDPGSPCAAGTTVIHAATKINEARRAILEQQFVM
ncbi:hypothetical protein GCM10011487_31200 [Steroidobacter agaridevorans]|uniref:Uncharacterized protein n=1 Tax=Steroidobacter agaridevorans TaxID=2695856 RepID=A0A829YCX5_9GAMM|nr:hypothetical protein GCM10011487_31200 [Steroidobacter agaridevorans]GFE88995.1 hypothetical protein GCM10011488_39490 [Steroidobacter agaridevorans]